MPARRLAIEFGDTRIVGGNIEVRVRLDVVVQVCEHTLGGIGKVPAGHVHHVRIGASSDKRGDLLLIVRARLRHDELDLNLRRFLMEACQEAFHSLGVASGEGSNQELDVGRLSRRRRLLLGLFLRRHGFLFFRSRGGGNRTARRQAQHA